MIEPDETPSETAIREALEETGYRITAPELIGSFFPSPGGSSERIFLHFAEVRDADRVGPGGGGEGEDVRVVLLPAAELFERLDSGLIDDAKLIIAANWLRGHLQAA
jgi:ADP-ribose pyrophosphatase